MRANTNKLDLLLGELEAEPRNAIKKRHSKQQKNQTRSTSDANTSNDNSENDTMNDDHTLLNRKLSKKSLSKKKQEDNTSPVQKKQSNINKEIDKKENDSVKYVSHVIGEILLKLPKSSILTILRDIKAPEQNFVSVNNYEQVEIKKDKKITISSSAISLLRLSISKIISHLLQKSAESRDLRGRETLIHQDLILAIYNSFDESMSQYLISSIIITLINQHNISQSLHTSDDRVGQTDDDNDDNDDEADDDDDDDDNTNDNNDNLSDNDDNEEEEEEERDDNNDDTAKNNVNDE